MATRRWSSKRMRIRSGLFCGSIYWVLLVSGRVFCSKTIIPDSEGTRRLLQGLSPKDVLRWIRAYATLWGEPERYGTDYWEKIPQVYFHWRLRPYRRGRLRLVRGPRRRGHQDRGPPSGHGRGGDGPAQAPSGGGGRCYGRPDELRGEVISAFVVVKNEYQASEELRKALLARSARSWVR